MYLFFDTETNGLPKNFKEKPSANDNWPRVIQLAAIVTDSKFQIQHTYCELIKPDNWVIPKEKFWIDNGFTTEQNEKHGYPMLKTLRSFIELIGKSEYIIAHNMSFDLPVMASEMMRYGVSTTHKTTKICTMKSTTDYCGLPRNKWPKLEELHNKIFGFDFDGAHDALNDVKATIRCFKYLSENKIITDWIC